MHHRFLALPLRPALAGVTFASLSVQITPTEQQKERRREAAEQCELFNLPERERPPALHPVEGRRLPVERFYFWFGSASKKRAYAIRFEAMNTGPFKSSRGSVSGSAARP